MRNVRPSSVLALYFEYGNGIKGSWLKGRGGVGGRHKECGSLKLVHA